MNMYGKITAAAAWIAFSGVTAMGSDRLELPRSAPADSPGPAIPRIVAPKGVEEKITLVELGIIQGDGNESPALLAGIAVEAVATVAKFITSALASAMNGFADQFGATYSKALLCQDFDPSGQTNGQRRVFLFRRSLVGPDRQVLEKLLQKSPGDLAQIAQGGGVTDVVHAAYLPPTMTSLAGGLNVKRVDGKYEIDVVSIPFVLYSVGTQTGSSFVVTDAVDSDWASIRNAWKTTAHPDSPSLPFFQKPIFLGLKGRSLGLSSIDKLEVAFTINLREAQYDGGPQISSWVAGSATLKGKDIPQIADKLHFSADWLPAPTMSRTYTLSVTVVESSKMKDWIKAASASLKQTADNQIDSWKSSQN